MPLTQTYHIHIKGIVQGVGYRPLVYAKAKAYGLKGYVKNGVNGLHVEVNGDEALVKQFADEVSVNSCPPLARISSVKIYEVDFVDYQKFSILQDEDESDIAALTIAPHFALCSECRSEMADPSDRRFNYPFISCTNCGPRYSIINALPYDRQHTEMDKFTMCESCETEYNAPTDRRYYSQTNSCPSCGIQLALYNNKKECITQDQEAIIKGVANAWRSEKIVAIKGIGGYLLTCDANNVQAIKQIRTWKKRARKPLALMYPNIDSLQEFELKTEEVQALEGATSPIVLISNKHDKLLPYKHICDEFDRVGVMIPYNPLFQVLLNEHKLPIVATSGNISKSPIIFKDVNAFNQLSQVAEYILTNNRNIVTPQDDSVILFTPRAKQKVILRRSRGIAPNYLNTALALQLESSLAMGADMKSAFCLYDHDTFYLSQFLGAITEYDTEKTYKETLQRYLILLKVSPQNILLDLHPNYSSSRIGKDLAKKLNLSTQAIQHHHAHLCALLGEHNLVHTDEKVLGVIWDGSGYGTDDNIWGGEFFSYQNNEFHRCAHLSYSLHIANDKMSREPRLSAFALLGNSTYCEAQLKEKFTKTEWSIYTSMQKKAHPILSSSMGRFFDAVACILRILDHQEYQGEAANLLEVMARKHFLETDYHIDIETYNQDKGSTILDPQVVLEKIIEDKTYNIPTEKIAAKFHLTLVHWIRSVALAESCKKLGFSGGVFQNSLLVDLIIISLGNEFELLFHKDLAPNDENIAFGQLIYASIRK